MALLTGTPEWYVHEEQRRAFIAGAYDINRVTNLDDNGVVYPECMSEMMFEGLASKAVDPTVHFWE